MFTGGLLDKNMVVEKEKFLILLTNVLKMQKKHVSFLRTGDTCK